MKKDKLLATSKDKIMVNKESLDALADNIQAVSDAMKGISKTRLKTSTIIKLIQIKTGLPIYKINQVINALQTLEEEFLKKEGKK
jgi:hypothetical protein